MGRSSAGRERPVFPPIPRELATLIDADGRYRWRGFVPGQDDPRWQKYKRLKHRYCAEAGIRLADFGAACRA